MILKATERSVERVARCGLGSAVLERLCDAAQSEKLRVVPDPEDGAPGGDESAGAGDAPDGDDGPDPSEGEP